MNYFFDFDGTIVDSLADIRRSYLEAMHELNYPTGDFDQKFRVGPPLMEVVRAMRPEATEEDCAVLASRFREIYDGGGYPLTLAYEGVPEALQKLRDEGNRLFIATNKRRLPTERILEKLELADYFEEVITPETANGELNKGELIEYVIAEKSLDKGSSYMIGDTVNDVEAGRYAGIKTIAVSWGYGENSELLASTPDEIINHPSEIPGLQ